MARQTGPTPEQYKTFQSMFDYYNRRLFAGRLPKVLLTFTRQVSLLGYFARGLWGGEDGPKVGEISLNPDQLARREPKEVASTLVHEMVHLWQDMFGKPGRRGYHNRDWAREMKRVGLMPSQTAAPGGAETGERVSHYILPGGPFEVAFEKARQKKLPWASFVGRASYRSKTRYTCEQCGVSVWGKPGLELDCRPCGLPLVGPETPQ